MTGRQSARWHLISEEALQDWLLEAGFVFWLPLPDGMRLFFERVEK